MELLDSRRLPGANILWERPCAVIDIAAEGAERDALIARWETEVRRRLDAVGWTAEGTCVRTFDGGASLALSAPLDALYAATEVNESAFAAAHAQLRGEPAPDFATDLARLRTEIDSESNPALLALQRAAHEHGVAFLSDDDLVSVGLGTGSQTWPVGELPAPNELDWSALHDVPTALVTGTNGKTTTIRLLSAIAEAAGKLPGVTSTDRVRVGNDVLEQGDWSGPGGARRVLRDTRTEIGLLETARGGMLRRGLALEHCDVSCVLNVGADHLGEWGVGSLAGLAEGKLTVTRVAPVVVLCADDEVLVESAAKLSREVIWFGLNPANPTLSRHLRAGGRACVLEDDVLWLRHGDERRRVLRADEIPITLGGAARYNTSNALAAAALADVLGFTIDEIRAGLGSFENSPANNPGRLNCFQRDGAHVIVDFAHNPHGLEATFEMARALPAERRLILLGQAGDRDDDSIREMARLTAAARLDMIVIKELTGYLRGRPLGEVPALIEHELRAAGTPPDRFVHCASELDAAHWALDWSRPGDLLLLLTHDSRDEILALLENE